jgi:hypothetical protein
MNSTAKFISRLSKESPTDNLENPYYGRSKLTLLRRENLRLYLEQMQAQNPEVLLLGEAPGYNGCGRTGIPFTSERTVSEENFFQGGGYQVAPVKGQLQSEQSAGILWQALQNWEPKPLIWNIFPFHPHQPGKLRSNRTPTEPELENGLDYLNDFLRLFEIRRIGAVGRKAEAKLSGMKIPFTYIRHPAHGGKRDFLAGVEEMRKTSLFNNEETVDNWKMV